MISAFWEMFKPLYAVDTLEGYTENEIAYVSRTHGCCRNISRSGNGCGNRIT